MHSRGALRVEKGSRDCLEHLWTIQSSPRPRSNSYFPGCTVQSAPNTDQIQLRSPLNEVSYDPFGTFGRQTAHLRPPSGWNTLPTRPPNCYWAIIIYHHGWTQQNATMGYCRFFENAPLGQIQKILKKIENEKIRYTKTDGYSSWECQNTKDPGNERIRIF